MLKKIVSLLLVFTMVFSFGIVSFADETASQEKVLIRNGKSTIGRTGVQVTKGAEAEITVDMELTCTTHEQIVEVIKEYESLFTQSQYQQIVESKYYKNKKFGAGLLCHVLGVCAGVQEGQSNYFKNANTNVTIKNDSKYKEFFNSISDVQQHKYKLTGTAKAVGLSLIPTEAFFVIEVTKMEFEDKTITVVNLNPETKDPDKHDGSGDLDLNEIEL